MKGIFPLEQFPLRERTPMCVALVIFLVVWVVMMLASANKAPGVATGIGFVLEASFLLAFAIGAIQMKALAQAREVLAGQPLPLSLWRTWVRASVAETSLAWAFLAAGMGTLLTTRGSNMPWLGAVSLLSSSMATGALCVLAQNAMAPKKLGWLANAAVVALLVAALIFGTGEVLTWFVGLPLPILALLALSWPALGAMLTLRLSGERGVHSDLAPASRHKWVASASRWMRRYTPLDATWARQPHARKPPRAAAWIGSEEMSFGGSSMASSMTPLRWEQASRFAPPAIAGPALPRHVGDAHCARPALALAADAGRLACWPHRFRYLRQYRENLLSGHRRSGARLGGVDAPCDGAGRAGSDQQSREPCIGAGRSRLCGKCGTGDSRAAAPPRGGRWIRASSLSDSGSIRGWSAGPRCRRRRPPAYCTQ